MKCLFCRCTLSNYVHTICYHFNAANYVRMKSTATVATTTTAMSMEKSEHEEKPKEEEEDGRDTVYTDTNANIPSIPTIRRSKCLHTNMKTVNTKFSIIVFCITVVVVTATAAAACSIQFSVQFSVLGVFGLSFSEVVSASYVQCVMNSFFLFHSFCPFLSTTHLLTLSHPTWRYMNRVRFVLHRVERVLCCIYDFLLLPLFGTRCVCVCVCWFCSYCW